MNTFGQIPCLLIQRLYRLMNLLTSSTNADTGINTHHLESYHLTISLQTRCIIATNTIRIPHRLHTVLLDLQAPVHPLTIIIHLVASRRMDRMGFMGLSRRMNMVVEEEGKVLEGESHLRVDPTVVQVTSLDCRHRCLVLHLVFLLGLWHQWAGTETDGIGTREMGGIGEMAERAEMGGRVEREKREERGETDERGRGEREITETGKTDETEKEDGWIETGMRLQKRRLVS